MRLCDWGSVHGVLRSAIFQAESCVVWFLGPGCEARLAHGCSDETGHGSNHHRLAGIGCPAESGSPRSDRAGVSELAVLMSCLAVFVLPVAGMQCWLAHEPRGARWLRDRVLGTLCAGVGSRLSLALTRMRGGTRSGA